MAGNLLAGTIDATSILIDGSPIDTLPVQINAANSIAFTNNDMLIARKDSDGSLIKYSWGNVKDLIGTNAAFDQANTAYSSSNTAVVTQINAATNIAFTNNDMLTARKDSDGSLIKDSWENVKSQVLSTVDTINGGPLGGFRNKIINGDFDIWQRGTSQTSSFYGSDDRWLNLNTGSTKTASRQTFTLGQTDVPGNPKYFSRTVVTSVAGAGNNGLKIQRIESVLTLAGKTATLTFWAKADANKNIAVGFLQNFGTGGSPSASVDFRGGLRALTTAWQKFSFTVAIPSISGKTLGGNANDTLDVEFWFDAGSDYNTRASSLGQQSGTFDIAHVSLVEGDATSEADPFSPRHPQQELALCQRYYQTGSFDGAFAVSTSNDLFGSHLTWAVPMRTLPTWVGIGNHNGGVIGTNVSFSLYGVTSNGGAPIRSAGSSGQAGVIFGSVFTADAEL